RRFVAQVKRNWSVPYAAMTQAGHVVVAFDIQKDGSITNVRVEAPSTVAEFNNSARVAIVTSNPTQPLPPEYPAAQAHFTVTFYYNEEPPTDPSTAATRFQRACDGDEFSACVSVGNQYANGNGVTRDEARAVALYSKACDGQDARGCSDLGFMKEYGRGIERDLPGAAVLYQKACDGGDMLGCSNLAA